MTYEIQIASDPAFTTIVDSATGLTGPTYDSGVSLDPDTVYYWRVRAVNPCGNGIYAAAWAFRTEAMVCTTYGPGETGNIRDSGVFNPRTTTFDLSIAASHTILDVNVIDLRGTHPNVGDLEFNLDSPASTRVQLINRMCSSADNFDKDLNDEAAVPVACPLDDNATQRPVALLSAYDGEPSNGTWTLRITDHVRNGSSGALQAWNLEICYGSGTTPADYSDLAASYGVAWHTGSGALRLGANWDADTTFALGDDDVTFPDGFRPGESNVVRVNVQGTPSSGRWLRLWFDWDENDTFDDSELVYNDSVNDGDNDISVNVPAGLSQPVYYRARLYDSAGAPTAQDPRSYGAAGGGEVEDGQSPAPTAVRLVSFGASPASEGILVAWETASEIDNLGFHLYRSTSLEALGERLNDTLIPSRSPGSGQGASYEYRDRTALPGITYYYTLEDVDASGGRTRHGPVALTLWRAYLPLTRR